VRLAVIKACPPHGRLLDNAILSRFHSATPSLRRQSAIFELDIFYDRILAWLLSQDTELSVHTLSIRGAEHRHLALINAFVRALGPALKKFQLGRPFLLNHTSDRGLIYVPADSTSVDYLDLSHNEELHSVTIFLIPNAPLRMISAMLSRISSTNIRSLTLGCIYVDINESGSIDDVDLLRVLESPCFQHLRLLILFFWAIKEHKLLESVLNVVPSHDKRGALSV
jgi:hypothetical protein